MPIFFVFKGEGEYDSSLSTSDWLRLRESEPGVIFA